MTVLDIILLACFLPALWYGWHKGLIHQLATVVSLVLSIYLAYHFSQAVSEWLGTWINGSQAVLKVVSYVLIFIVVAAAIRLLAWALGKLMKFIMLGWVNRLGGVILAALWTAMLLGLLIMLFNTLNISLHLVKDEALAGAGVYQFLKNFAYTVFPFMKELLF